MNKNSLAYPSYDDYYCDREMQSSKPHGENGVNQLINDINYNRKFWFVRCFRKNTRVAEEQESDSVTTPENDSEDSRDSASEVTSVKKSQNKRKINGRGKIIDCKEDNYANKLEDDDRDVTGSSQKSEDEYSSESEDISDSEEYLEWSKRRNEIKEISHRCYVTADPSVCSTHSFEKFNSHWLLEAANQKIEELPEVDEKTKKMMKMWNAFSMRHKFDPFLKEALIKACESFIEENREHIIQNNLIQEMVFHFKSFVNHNLLTSNEVVEVCATLSVPSLKKKTAGRKSKSPVKSISNPPDIEVKERLRSAKKSNN